MSAEPIFVDLSESKPTEIESLCMKCQENVSLLHSVEGVCYAHNYVLYRVSPVFCSPRFLISSKYFPCLTAQ